MKKTNVTISFDEEKLTALRLYMGQKELQLENELLKAMEGFYGKHVPANVREFIEMCSDDISEHVPKVKRPKPEKKEQLSAIPKPMNGSKGEINHE